MAYLRKEIQLHDNLSVFLEDDVYNRVFPTVESFDVHPMISILKDYLNNVLFMNPRDPTPEFLQHIQLPAASYKILMGFDAGSPWPYIRDPQIIAELNATYSLTESPDSIAIEKMPF